MLARTREQKRPTASFISVPTDVHEELHRAAAVLDNTTVRTTVFSVSSSPYPLRLQRRGELPFLLSPPLPLCTPHAPHAYSALEAPYLATVPL